MIFCLPMAAALAAARYAEACLNRQTPQLPREENVRGSKFWQSLCKSFLKKLLFSSSKKWGQHFKFAFAW